MLRTLCARCASRFEAASATTHVGLCEACLDPHSKVTIVDDEWLRIGSSNISNRSMGVDTECDVTIEARGDERVQRVIRAFRDRLLAEHAGASFEETTNAIARAGNIARAIEKLGSEARRLETLDAPELPESVLGIASVGDPEQPVSLEGLVRQIAPDTSGKRIASGPIIVGIAILVAVALALVWRLTPLADIVTPERGGARASLRVLVGAVVLMALHPTLLVVPRGRSSRWPQ